MIKIFENGIIIYVLAAFLLLGIISRTMASFRYGKLIKITNNLGNTKERYFKQLKGRFENTYRMSGGIEDIPLYLDKQMRGYKLAGIPLVKWDKLIRKSAFFCFFIGIASGAACYYLEADPLMIIYHLGAGTGLTVACLLFDWAVDTSYKSGQVLLNLQEYFMNTIKHRLDNGMSITTKGNISNDAKKDIEFLKNNMDKIAASREPLMDDEDQKHGLTEEEGQLIEEVISEYMT